MNPLYQWRYQVPASKARRQSAQLRAEARAAAIRDAAHDGWAPTAPAAVSITEADGLDDVAEIVVTFAVEARTVATVDPELDDIVVEERFDAAPLVAIVDRLDVPITAAFDRNSALLRAYHRGKSRGWFDLRDADRLTVHLGHTLDTVWPTYQKAAA